MTRLVFALGLVIALAAPAGAQQLSLQISDGRVTLDAANVPARQILAEWARIGGTKVVGAEKIVGAPLTLKLTDMPERQALEIILRNVAGFMAAPRQASADPGASAYDRILIMATSSVAPAQNNPRAGGPQMSGQDGLQRRVPPRPPNFPGVVTGDEPADDQDDEVMDDQADAEPPVFTFPNQPTNPAGAPVFVPMQNGNPAFGTTPGAVTSPVITLQPGENGPTIYNFVPNAAQGGAVPPASPTPGFTIIGSPTPGMIQVPPQAPGQPTQPPPTRPPGQ